MATERITLGSGKLYVTTATATNGVYTIPADNTIETAANLLGHIQGGATVEYTPEFYTVQDDLQLVYKKFLTKESVVFKSGVLTWNGEVLKKLCSTAQVSTDTASTPKTRTVKIGGLENFDDQMYIIRFVHTEEGATDLKTRLTMVGNNTAGFELQFNPSTETVINAEFECIGGVGDAGVLIVYKEDDPSVTA